MKSFFLIVQIFFSSALVILILIQAKGTGLGRAFGGLGGVYSTRRGIEKIILYLTVVFSVLFFISSLVQLLIA